MRWHIALMSVLALLPAGSVLAQTTHPSERMDRFEQRLDEMETRHQAELKARDEEIARLKAMVQSQPSPLQPLNPQPTTAPLDSIESAKQAVLKDIAARQAPAQTLRVPASFNPDFAVIGDFVGNISTRNDNPARNRFDLDSVELDLRAAVDPRADAVVVLPISRDIDDPLFFNPATANGNVDTSIDIEEAYLLLHDFGVPNLTAKLGRFHLRFGRWNQMHSHNWPTVDNAFAVQSFLGPEALEDSGLSLSYVLPPKLVGDQYIELVAEIISGEGSDGAPVLNNNAFVDGPALNTHMLWNHDIAKDWNIEVGGSWLTGRHDNDQDANIYGADVTLIHIDPTGRFNNQLLQGEVFYGDVGTRERGTQSSTGAYVLAQQQLNRDWYIGTRLDWTQDALNDNKEIWGASASLTWYLSEFLRLRVEYEHRGGNVPDEDIVWFQCNFVFGAHPPHPYWAMR
jgi:hypothetical protein